MRKLTEAEKKLLEAFPKDLELSNGEVFPGEFGGCRAWPKHTHVKTVEKLYRLGLIEHGWVEFYSCPMRLTEEGKKLIGRKRQL